MKNYIIKLIIFSAHWPKPHA